MDHVHYRIIPGDPAGHLFEIELTVAHPEPQGQVLSLPAWIPGSYMIRDFARNIVALTASCAGSPVGVEKLDKQTWRCAPCSGPLRVSYQVYAWDLSVRAAHLDPTHGYFNGTSTTTHKFAYMPRHATAHRVREANRSHSRSYGEDERQSNR